MAKILYGKPVLEKIKSDIQNRVSILTQRGKVPGLAILRAGDRSDDIVYENRVTKLCDALGIKHVTVVVHRAIAQEDLAYELRKLNVTKDVQGILVFRPLPDHIDDDEMCRIISQEKDIDCMNPINLQNVFTGLGEGFTPCTPEAVLELLEYYGYNLDGANVVIVNRSLVLGKPLSMMLMQKTASGTIFHSHTKKLREITRRADILVTVIGKAGYFGEEYASENTTVVDVGINFANGRMTGDVDFEAMEQKAAAVTPVPGGIGSITSIILLRHLVESAERYR